MNCNKSWCFPLVLGNPCKMILGLLKVAATRMLGTLSPEGLLLSWIVLMACIIASVFTVCTFGRVRCIS